MASSKVIRKLIGGITYAYDCEHDIIADGRSARVEFDRTLVTNPVDICIECTTWCNLSCKNCFSESRAGAAGRHISAGALISDLERTASAYVRICLTGGEPLLHPYIARILSLPETISDCGFVITMNGTVRQDLDDLLCSNEWLSAVSLHGMKESHNGYAGSNTFDVVQGRIRRLASRTTTHIYCIVHNRLTYRDVDWLIRFRAESGAAVLRFIIPRAFGRYEPLVNGSIIQHIEAVRDSRTVLKRTASVSHLLSVTGDLRRSH